MADTGEEDDATEDVFRRTTLPCGVIVPNRLVKAAMYEHGACFTGGLPNVYHYSLYNKWAKGGWGMIITGNIQVDRFHLTLGADIAVPRTITPETILSFRLLADAMRGETFLSTPVEEYGKSCNGGPLVIAQLSHSGRQAPIIFGNRLPFNSPLSPSATRLQPRFNEGVLAQLFYRICFQTAKEMTLDDIDKVVDEFVRATEVMVKGGFDGVQLHAAHGYLLAQFISRATNFRTDEYGEPLFFLHRVCKAIRSVVPTTFILGVKINAADYTSGGLTEADAKLHLIEIATWGVDFVEISGGDYQSSDFMRRSSSRQAFFEDFSEKAVGYLSDDNVDQPRPLIMLTGGLRSPEQLSSALRNNHADLLGLGRMSVLYPDLPNILRTHSSENPFIPTADPSPVSPEWWPKLVGAGVSMAWYVVSMRDVAASRKLPLSLGPIQTVLLMYFGHVGYVLVSIGIGCAALMILILSYFML